MRNATALMTLCLCGLLFFTHYMSYQDGFNEGVRVQQEIEATCPAIVVELGEPMQTHTTPDLRDHEPLFTPLDLDEVFSEENQPRIRSMFDPKYKPDPEIKRLPPVENTEKAKPPKRERGGDYGPVDTLCQRHKLPTWYEPVYWGHGDIEPRLVGGGLQPITKEPGVVLSGFPHTTIRVTQYEWNLINLRRAQGYADPLVRLDQQRKDYDMVRMNNHGEVCWWTRNGK